MRLGPERLAVAPEVIPGAVKASAIRSASFHGAHKLSSLAAASQARWLSPPNVCTPSPSRRRPLATQRPSLPRSCAASLLPCAPARLRRRLARQHLVTTASPPTAAAQHALAHQGRRPLRLHPPPRAPEVEGHQVAHPQPPVGDVVHRLPRDVVVALRHNQGPAHPPLEYIRRPVPVPRDCRHLLAVRQRGPRPVREDVCCYGAPGRHPCARHTTILATIAPHINMAVPIQ